MKQELWNEETWTRRAHIIKRGHDKGQGETQTIYTKKNKTRGKQRGNTEGKNQGQQTKLKTRYTRQETFKIKQELTSTEEKTNRQT